MKYTLLDLLQCPHCESSLEIHTFTSDVIKYEDNTLRDDNVCPSSCSNPDKEIIKKDDTQGHCRKCYEYEIDEGLLSCGCGKAYPVIRGIPRFLPDSFDQHSEFTQKYYNEIKKYEKDMDSKDKEYFRKMFKKTQGTFGGLRHESGETQAARSSQ